MNYGAHVQYMHAIHCGCMQFPVCCVGEQRCMIQHKNYF